MVTLLFLFERQSELFTVSSNSKLCFVLNVQVNCFFTGQLQYKVVGSEWTNQCIFIAAVEKKTLQCKLKTSFTNCLPVSPHNNWTGIAEEKAQCNCAAVALEVSVQLC